MKSKTQEPDELVELLAKKNKFVEEKHALQAQIVDINQRCCTRMPHWEFKNLQQRRAEAIRKIGNIEGWLTEIKGKLQAASIGRNGSRTSEAQALWIFKKRLLDLCSRIDSKSKSKAVAEIVGEVRGIIGVNYWEAK